MNQKIQDRAKSEELLKEISAYLDMLQDLSFPSFLSLKENSEKIYGNGENEVDRQENSDIDAKQIDYIDYKLDCIRLRKDFFAKPKKGPRMGTFLKDQSHEIQEIQGLFRERDFKLCLYEYTKTDRIGDWMEETYRKKREWESLGDAEFKRRKMEKFRNIKII